MSFDFKTFAEMHNQLVERVQDILWLRWGQFEPGICEGPRDVYIEGRECNMIIWWNGVTVNNEFEGIPDQDISKEWIEDTTNSWLEPALKEDRAREEGYRQWQIQQKRDLYEKLKTEFEDDEIEGDGNN